MSEIQEFEIIIRHTMGERMPQDFTLGHCVSEPEDTATDVFKGLAGALRQIAQNLDCPPE